jgi:hypothetical protein
MSAVYAANSMVFAFGGYYTSDQATGARTPNMYSKYSEGQRAPWARRTKGSLGSGPPTAQGHIRAAALAICKLGHVIVSSSSLALTFRLHRVRS